MRVVKGRAYVLGPFIGLCNLIRIIAGKTVHPCSILQAMLRFPLVFLTPPPLVILLMERPVRAAGKPDKGA